MGTRVRQHKAVGLMIAEAYLYLLTDLLTYLLKENA